MKQIDIGKLSESEKKETVKEAKILEVLSHPNIVKFIEVFKTKNGKLCIVMDFADGMNTYCLTLRYRWRLAKQDKGTTWEILLRGIGARVVHSNMPWSQTYSR